MHRLLLIAFSLIFTSSWSTMSTSGQDIVSQHQKGADLFYGQFIGSGQSNFRTAPMPVAKEEKEYYKRLETGDFPATFPMQRARDFIKEHRYSADSMMLLLYAQTGENLYRFRINPSNIESRVDIDEISKNEKFLTHISHDFRSMWDEDDFGWCALFWRFPFEPAPLLYPLSVVDASVRIEPIGQERLLAEWVSDSTESLFISMQAILDAKSGLPLKTLLSFSISQERITTRFTYCEFSDFREEKGTVYPAKWSITQWVRHTENAFEGWDAEMLQAYQNTIQEWALDSDVVFDIKNEETFILKPHWYRYEMEYTPLDPEPIVKNPDAFFWREPIEGYQFKDERSRAAQ